MKKEIIEFSDEIDALVTEFLDEKVKPKLDLLWRRVKKADPGLTLDWVEDTPCLARAGIIDMKLSRAIRLAALGQKPSAAARRRPDLVKLMQIIELVNERFGGKVQFD